MLNLVQTTKATPAPGKEVIVEELIDALYMRFLFRKTDVVAKLDKCRRIADGTTSIADMISEILDSQEFASKFPQFTSSLTCKPQDSGRFSNNQSQFNEIDALLAHILAATFRHKVVVDVGARGKERSNSWDLMRHFGWRGVLVEANPRLSTGIHSEFAGLNYKLIQCAVSDYAGEARFTLGVNDDVSSLNPDAAQSWGDTKGELMVEVRRLPEILNAEGVPIEFGLLSLDIEGEDIKVLNDLIDNSEYRPAYIIIEASQDFRVKSLDDLPVSPTLKEQYAIVGQTRANLILNRIQ